MKKTLLLAGLMALTTSLLAEKISLAKAFETLAGQCTDFTPLMGPADKDVPYWFSSSFEVEGAQRSYFRINKSPLLFSNIEDVTEYIAHFGSFNSRAEADQFVQMLQDQVKTSIPIISFAQESVNQQVKEINYRFVLNPDSRLIVFDAFLRVETIGSFSHVDFIFPQVKQGPCSTEYTIIQEEAVNSDFSAALKNILGEATQDFTGIKGEELDPFEATYETNFMPPGYEHCYLQSISLENATYFMPVCIDVKEETMRAKSEQIFSQLASAMGSDYAYSISPSGWSIFFVHKKYPVVKLARINVSQKEATFSIVVSFYANRLSPYLFF